MMAGLNYSFYYNTIITIVIEASLKILDSTDQPLAVHDILQSPIIRKKKLDKTDRLFA
jgi:hypothetical protein